MGASLKNHLAAVLMTVASIPSRVRDLRVLCVLVLSALPWAAIAQASCTAGQIETFSARCAAHGASAAAAEASCFQQTGSHHYCGFYPWPSKVFPIEPARLECRIYWVRSPSGHESSSPSSIGVAEAFDCPIPLELTLSGPSATSAFPGGRALLQSARVTQNGAPASGKTFHISMGSGGVLSGTTDTSGEFAFTFVPPAYATTETVTAHCDGCTAPATKTITVDAAELMCTP